MNTNVHNAWSCMQRLSIYLDAGRSQVPGTDLGERVKVKVLSPPVQLTVDCLIQLESDPQFVLQLSNICMTKHVFTSFTFLICVYLVIFSVKMGRIMILTKTRQLRQ